MPVLRTYMGDSLTVHNQVALAALAASRATQCVVLGLLWRPFLPASHILEHVLVYLTSSRPLIV